MTSVIPTLLNATSNTSQKDICGNALQPTPYQTFYAAVVAVLMVMDVFILTAVVARWSVLRRNVVHVYVISLLLSVICFCVISMAELFQSVHKLASIRIEGGLDQKYNSSDPTHVSVYRDDAFLKSMQPLLLLIMEFNIAALVYAISDGTLIVGRYGEAEGLLDKLSSNEDEFGIRRNRLVKWKKLKASVVLVAAWTIPLILSIPVAFGWNCIEHCQCLPMYRTMPTCVAPPGSGTVCSRTWPPMSRSFVLTTSVLFFICITIMAITLISTIRKFYKTHAPRSKLNGSTTKDFTEHKQEATSEGGSMVADATDYIRKADEVETKSGDISRNRPSIYTRKGRPPLGDTINLIIYLTICLFLFISPLELLWFCDVLREKGWLRYISVMQLQVTMLRANFKISMRSAISHYSNHSTRHCGHALWQFNIFCSGRPGVNMPEPDEWASNGTPCSRYPTVEAFSILLAITFLYVVSVPVILLIYMAGVRNACIFILMKCPFFSKTVVTVKHRVATKKANGDRSNRNSQAVHMEEP